jgi:predicted NBD/HSP70 family sugar kinase
MGTEETDGGALSTLSRAVAIEILVHGAESRARLAERMGLSAATLTRLVRPLVEAGVLAESDAVRPSGRGRAFVPLDVVPDRYRFIGVKLTEDSIFAVVTDVRSRILDEISTPLLSLRVADVVDSVRLVVGELQARSEQPVTAVGVTVGGRVDDGEVVADSPFLHWKDVPFRSLLRSALGLPVHLQNDVVGLTKAQHWFGYGKGIPSFALLTVGAGIGYGLVINDVMVPTVVTPVSHYPVDPSGPLCPLGHRGCLTAYLASHSMAAAVSAAHGRIIGYDDVLSMARGGDPTAGRVVREAARALGRAAAAITTLTGVNRIILTGEGVHLVDAARTSVDEGRAEYDVEGALRGELIVRPMGFFEWARGAAVIAIQQEFPDPTLSVDGHEAPASRRRGMSNSPWTASVHANA